MSTELSTIDNRSKEILFHISVEDPTKPFERDIATIEESVLKENFISIRDKLLKKENFYITAVKNLLKKINFLELYQQLLEDQITESEFNEEIERESSKYIIDIKELQDPDDLTIILDIVNKITFDLKDFSLNEINELFSVDLHDHVKLSKEAVSSIDE